MTTKSVLRAVLARWPLTLVGLVLTALGVQHVLSAPPLYYGEVAVHFLAPSSATNPNRIQTETISLVQTAGIVKSVVNEGHYLPAESLSLTIRSSGPASSVSLPNSGSQWFDIYATPMLLVEATGRDPDDVARSVSRAEDRIRRVLDSMQNSDGVNQFNRITVSAAPAAPTVAPQATESRRAAVAVVLLGGGLTLWLTSETDRWLRRRVARRRLRAAVSGAASRG